MSIRELRERLTRDESGLGIVEIIVALMIFAIVTVGMTYSMISMTRLTGDAAARETATNLAAAEIDRLGSVKDAFTIPADSSSPKQVVVDGITFHVATNTSWVGANGSTGKCGIGTAGTQLLYKRVRVEVTWDGMYLPNPVRADSAVAPGTRINDPTTGTILVSITREGGEGQQGIAVSATKTSSGAGITDAIDPTDVDGCTYVLKTPPGNYDLTITKSGYINTTQNLLPQTQSIVVTAGSATPVPLQADLAQTYTLKYAQNSARPSIKLPTSMDVTYFGQAASGPLNEVGSGTRKLYPWTSGYQVLAGNPSTCAAVDPEKWTATSTKYAGVRAAAVPASPGGSGNLPVGMGVASVVMPTGTDTFLTAVAQSVTTGGNPGCSAGTTLKYAFAAMTPGTTYNVALPFGTWKLYRGASAGTATTQITTGITFLDSALSNVAGGLATGVTGGGAVASGVLTLDPRMTKP